MVMTLTCAKVVERAHMLSQWIQIAMEVQSMLGNLFAFDNIMAGLMSDQVNNFVCLFVFLLYVPSQQLWSWRDGQFILPHFFLGKLEQAFIDGWLRMGLLPPPPIGNFADVSYLVEN